jgi:hypothetical protein
MDTISVLDTGPMNRWRWNILIECNFFQKDHMKTARTLLVLMTAGALCLSLGLSGCKKETVERTDTEQQIDQQLAQQVKVAFGDSLSFKFPDVQVASFKGKVQLSGFVRSEGQKSSAETIAKAIPGVLEVENNISLKQ